MAIPGCNALLGANAMRSCGMDILISENKTILNKHGGRLVDMIGSNSPESNVHTVNMVHTLPTQLEFTAVTYNMELHKLID